MEIFGKGNVARDFGADRIQVDTTTPVDVNVATAEGGYNSENYFDSATLGVPGSRVQRVLKEALEEQYGGSLDGEIGAGLAFLDTFSLARFKMNEVQKSNAEHDLLYSEGTWLPQIDFAANYLQLRKKKEELENISTNPNVADKDRNVAAMLLGEVNDQIQQMEPIVKYQARTNPYLQDIFYNTNVWDNMMDYKNNTSFIDNLRTIGSTLVTDWADDRLLDVNPFNNLKSALARTSDQFASLSDEKAQRMWDMREREATLDQRIKALEEVRKNAQIEFDIKSDDIQTQINDMTKPSWFLDPTKIDPDYKLAQSQNEISWNPKTWGYAIPEIGTSYGEGIATLLQLGTSVGVAALGRNLAVNTPQGKVAALGLAATEQVINFGVQLYLRKQETDSEVFDAVIGRIQEVVEKNPEKIQEYIDVAKPRLATLGYDVDNLSIEQMFRSTIASGIPTEDTELGKIIEDAKNNVDAVYWTNMALMIPDLLTQGMFSYGGKILNKSLNRSRVLRRNAPHLAGKQSIYNSALAENIIQKTGGEEMTTAVQFGMHALDKSIFRAADKLAKSPANKLLVKDVLKGTKDFALSTVLKGITEGLEEGQQTIVSKRYQAGEYDDTSFSMIEGLINSGIVGIEAGLAFYGLHPDDRFNNDDELKDAMSIGAFTGAFMGNIQGIAFNHSTLSKLRTDMRLKEYIADLYERNENANKVSQFLHAANGNFNSGFDKIEQSLVEIRDNYTNLDITAEMVNEDLQLLNNVKDLAKNKNLNKSLNNLGIRNTTSEDYSTVIANAIDLQNRLTRHNNESKLTEQEYQQSLLGLKTNPDVIRALNDYNKNKAADEQLTIDEFVSLIERGSLKYLNRQLKNRETFLNRVKEQTGLDIDSETLTSIASQIESEVNALDDKSAPDTVYSIPASLLEAHSKSFIAKKLNDATQKYLQNHLDAYTRGTYDTNIAGVVKFKDLTESQKTQIVSDEQQYDLDNNRKVRSEAEIAEQYDSQIDEQLKYESDNKSLAAQHRIQEDLSIAKEKIQKDKESKQSLQQTKPQQTVNDGAIVEQHDTGTRVKVSQEQLSQEEEEAKRDVERELYGEEEAARRRMEVQDQEEQVSGELFITDGADIATREDLPFNEQQAINYQPTEEPATQDLTPPQSEDSALQDLTPDGTPVDQNRVESPVESNTQPVTDYSESELTPDNDFEPVSHPSQSQPTDLDETVEKPKSELEVEQPEVQEQPSVDPTDLTNSEDVREDLRPDYKGDPGADRIFLDDTGGLYVNAEPIDDGAIDMTTAQPVNDLTSVEDENMFDDQFMSNPSSQTGRKTNRLERDENKVNHISDTMFYRPNSTEAMTPVTAQYDSKNKKWNAVRLMFRNKLGKLVNARPGAELALRLLDPNFLKNANIYYVCTFGLYTTNAQNLFDTVGVFMVIESDGMVYLTAMRNSDDATRTELESASGYNLLPSGAQKDLLKAEIDGQMQSLKDLRRKIILSYWPQLFSSNTQFGGFTYNTEVVDGETVLVPPQHVRPVPSSLSQSNGSLVNTKDEYGLPVFHNLMDVPLMGLQHEDGSRLTASELSERLTDTSDPNHVILSYGGGPFAAQPFALVDIATDEYSDILAKGHAGKIYITPNPNKTPSGRITSPIVLSPKFSRPFSGLTTEEMKTRWDVSGKVVNADAPISVAELIFELMIGKFAVGTETQHLTEEEKRKFEKMGKDAENIVFFNDVLSILVNQGKKTAPYYIFESDDPAAKSKFGFLIRKTLFRNMSTDPTTGKVYMSFTRGVRKQQMIGNDPNQIITTWGIETLVRGKIGEDQRKRAIKDISQNTHWNFNANAMVQPIPESIKRNVVNIVQARIDSGKFTTDKVTLFGCAELTFDLEDFGMKVEKLPNGSYKIVEDSNASVTPVLGAWLIKTGKLVTDIDPVSYYAPFVYSSDVYVDEQSKSKIQSTTEVQPKQVTEEGKTVTEKVKDTVEPNNASQSDSKALGAIQTPKPITTSQKTDNVLEANTEAFNSGYIHKKPSELIKAKVIFIKDSIENRIKYDEEIKANGESGAIFRVNGKPIAIDGTHPFNEDPKKGFVAALVPAEETNTFDIKPMLSRRVAKSRETGVFSTERGEGKVNIERAAEWLEKYLGIPKDKVLTVNALLATASNEHVFGIMRVVASVISGELNPQIVLRNDAGLGIEYHEGFHYVSLLLLPENERKQVYNDYRRTHTGIENLTDSQVEELLAEEFRKYMLDNNKKGLRYAVIRFFNNLKYYVDVMFNRSTTVKGLFRKIAKGKFKNNKPSQQILQEFSQKHGDGVFYYVPGLSDELTKKLKSISDSGQFFRVIQSIKNTFFGVFKVRTESDVADLNYNTIFDAIEDQLSWGSISEDNQNVVLEILDNKDIFKKYISEYLSQLGLSITKNKVRRTAKDLDRANQLSEEDQVRLEDGDTNDNNWDREQGQISKKTNTAFLAKLFFYSVPKYEIITVTKTDENGNSYLDKEVTQVTDELLQLPVTVPFDEVWTRVLDSCWNIETYQDLVDKVHSLAESDGLFYAIDRMLNDPENPLTQQQKIQLEVTVKSSKLKMDTVKYDNAEIARKNAASTRARGVQDLMEEQNQNVARQMSKTLLKLFDSDALRIASRIPSRWSKQFFSSNKVTQENGINKLSEKFVNTLNYFLFGKQNGKVLAQDCQNVYNKYSKKKGKVQDIIADELVLRKGIINTFSILGLPINNIVLDNVIQDYTADTRFDTGNRALDVLLTLWGDVKTNNSIRGGILQPLYTMATQGKGTVQYRGGKLTINRVFNRSNPDNVINLFARGYAKVYPSSQEFSVVGPDGSLIYPIAENNMITDIFRWLNDKSNKYVKQLLNSTYAKRSLLLNQESPNLSVSKFLMLDLDDGGRNFLGITPLEDYVVKLLLTFNDRMIFPTMADKGTWYNVSGIKLPKSVLHTVEVSKVMNPETGELVTSVDQVDARFNDETLSIFANYFYDEYDAVVEYYQNKEKVANNPKLYRKNYHGKIKNGKMQPGGNGGRFRYFTRLQLANGENLDLNNRLDILERYGTTEEVLQYLKEIKNKLEQDDNLKTGINKLLLQRVEDELKQAVKLGVIRVDNGMYGNRSIPQNIIEYYSSVNSNNQGVISDSQFNNELVSSIIGNHVVASMISIIELEKVATGDPAFYKSVKFDYTTERLGELVTAQAIKDTHTDKTKRLGSAMSIGTNTASDLLEDTSIRTLYAKDFETGLDEYKFIYTTFRNQIILDIYQQQNPEVTPREVYERFNSQEKIEEIYKSLDSKKKKFVDEFSKNSAAPYNYSYSKEDKGELKPENRDGGSITTTDGCTIISAEAYRRFMISYGEWDEQSEQAYQMIEGKDTSWMSDPERYEIAKNLLVKPLKMIYFGQSAEPSLGLSVPILNKTAMFPLFKVMALGDNQFIYERMNDGKKGRIDMITFDSATKVGNGENIEFYDVSGNVFDKDQLKNKSYNKVGTSMKNTLPVHVQDMRFFRLQLNTDPHADLDRSFGTQVMKVGFANVQDERDYSDTRITKTGKQIKQSIMQCINSLTELGNKQVIKQFYTNGTIDNEKVYSWLRKQAQTDGMSLSFIESLNSNTPLEANPNRRWIETKLTAFANKRIVNINTPGGAAIQMPEFGFRRTVTFTESEANLKEMALNNGDRLNFINPDGSMDIILSANFFRHITPVQYQTSYATMRKWLKDNNVIGKNAEPLHIGYRIPTQGLSSTVVMRCVDITPTMFSDIVIVPDGFTSMTGSDYDIDKLFISTKFLKFDENGNKVQFKEGSEEYLVNELLENYILVMSDRNNLSQTKASIDTLTNILKKQILPLVQKSENKEQQPMYQLLPSFQLDRKNEFTQGKTGIATFALNTTNHSMTQWAGLDVVTQGIPKKYNLKPLYSIWGIDGYRISDWLSAMINAHVDVAKDPYVITLNVNEVTYNICNYLLRTGMGQNTFLFLAQKSLKQFAERKIAGNGVWGVNEKQTDDQIMRNLYDEYFKYFDNTLTKLNSELSQIQDQKELDNKHSKLDKLIHRYNYLQSLINRDNAFYMTDSTGQAVIGEYNASEAFTEEARMKRSLAIFNGNHSTNTIVDWYCDLLDAINLNVEVLHNYTQLSKPAEVMSNLIQLTQIDTKKFGNTVALQSNYLNSIYTFIKNNGKDFTVTNLDQKLVDAGMEEYNTNDPSTSLWYFYKASFLWDKFIKATSNVKNVLSTQLISATKGFDSLFTQTMGEFLGVEESDSKDSEVQTYRRAFNKKFVQTIHTTLASIIRANVISSNQQLHLSDTELNSLFFGNNTIANRLSDVKSYVILNRNNEVLSRLVDNNGNIKNDFLNYLQEDQADGTQTFASKIVLRNNALNNSSYTEDSLIAAFQELYECPDPRVQAFVSDIVKYAYVTSWDERGSNNFTHLIPNQIKQEIGYSDQIQEQLNEWKDLTYQQILDMRENGEFSDMALTIARNYYDDPTIVQRYTIDESKVGKDWVVARGAYPIVVAINPRKLKGASFFTSQRNGRLLFYHRIGEVQTTDRNGEVKTTKFVYAVAPALGFKDGNFRVRELDKNGLDASSYDYNKLEYTTPSDNEISEAIKSKGFTTKRGSVEYTYVSNSERIKQFSDPYTRKDQVTPSEALIDEYNDIFSGMQLNSVEQEIIDLNTDLSNKTVETTDLSNAEELVANDLSVAEDEVAAAIQNISNLINFNTSEVKLSEKNKPVSKQDVTDIVRELTENSLSIDELNSIVEEFVGTTDIQNIDRPTLQEQLRKFLCNR